MYAGLVVLVFGVKACLEVVYQLTDYLPPLQHHLRPRARPPRPIGCSSPPPSPLGDLPLQVEGASLGAASTHTPSTIVRGALRSRRV